MILLIITMVCLIGSVAATDTASNDTITIQQDTTVNEVSDTSISSTANGNSAIENTVSSTSSSKTSSDTSSQTTNSIQSASTSQSTTSSSTVSTNSTKNKSIQSTSNTNKSIKSSSSSSKKDTKMSVNNVTIGGYDTFKLRATVIDKTSGKYVNEGTVVFKINGKTIGNSKVIDGKAVYSYKLTGFSSKTYTITAKYTGTSTYNPSSATNILKVKKYATTMNIKTIKEYAGTKITFKTTVKTKSGLNVKSGNVVYKINGKTIGRTTVSNGVATLTYTIPSSWKDTSYKVTVKYGGNNIYKPSEGTGKLYLKNTIKTNVKVTTNAVASGKTTKITAVITSKDGSYIKNGNVAFKINGKTIGHSKVTNGIVSVNYAVPSNWSGKNYKVTVTYSGHDLYKSSTGTAKLKVYESTKTSVTSITSNKGSTVTFTATIKTNDGSKVKNGNVAFKINGKTIGHTTVSNGVATLKYTIPSNWNDKTYKINVVYGGSSKYYSSNGTGTLSLNTVSSTYSKYLKQTKNCQVNSATIQKLAKWYNATYSNTYSKAKAIFNDLNARTSYSYYYNTRYGALGTYTKKVGNCVDMSHLLIAVSRAAGIPARYCHATCTFRSGLVVGHVWTEINVNGKWYECDLTSNSNSFGKIVNWRYSTTVHRYIELPF